MKKIFCMILFMIGLFASVTVYAKPMEGDAFTRTEWIGKAQISAYEVNCNMSREQVTGSTQAAPMPQGVNSCTPDESMIFNLHTGENIFIKSARLEIYKNGKLYRTSEAVAGTSHQHHTVIEAKKFPVGSYTCQWELIYAKDSIDGTIGHYKIGNEFYVSRQIEEPVQNLQESLTYVIFLDENFSGGQVENKTVMYGGTYGTLQTPTRKGYNFAGWYTASEGGTSIKSTTKVTLKQSHTLYAHWNVKSYTVSFDANGGSCSTKSKSVKYEFTYGTLPTPTKKGYTFDGWYFSLDEDDVVTEERVVYNTSNHTLYAKWKANQYKVFFDGRAGYAIVTYGSIYGSSYGDFPTVTKPDCTFDGWYTSAAGGTRVTEATIVSTAKDHTLYPHWTGKSFRISFQANGGSVKTANKTITIGKQYGTLPTPTRNNYTFAGWFTEREGGDKIQATDIVDNNDDLVLYAHWSKAAAKVYVTVKFNANGGKVSTSSKKVVYGNKYGSLPTPKRSGYDFVGWYTSAKSGKKISKSTKVSVKGTQKLYARWGLKRPSKFEAKSVNETTVKMTWKKVTGAASYTLYRRFDNESSWKKLKTVKASTTSYTDKNNKYFERNKVYLKIESNPKSGSGIKKNSYYISYTIPQKALKISKSIVAGQWKISWAQQKNISKIEVCIGSSAIGTRTLPLKSTSAKEYSFNPSSLPKGQYTMWITVYYNSGGKKDSNKVTFTK